MPIRLVQALLVLIVLSAVAVFVFYAAFSLSNPAARFGQTEPLVLAGKLEASRNLALAVMLVAALLWRNRAALVVVLSIAGLIELGDAWIGLSEQQMGGVTAPLLSGMLYLVTAVVLLRWKSPTPGLQQN
jgi:hypothetical protein